MGIIKGDTRSLVMGLRFHRVGLKGQGLGLDGLGDLCSSLREDSSCALSSF